MPIDDRTPNLNLALPSEDNTLLEDVPRLRSALTAIDAAFPGKANVSALAAKADLVDGKVPAIQLPSYVDDVVEVANAASLPTVGEAGKIYVTLDNEKIFRWSGSIYIELSPSPGSTDAVPEGAANKYFTDARARAAQQPATSLALGVVKVGSGLNVAGDGTISVAGGGGGGSGLPAFNETVIVPASNGQTSFTVSGGYTPGQIEIYLNGVLQYGNGDDYTASDGSTFTLTAGASTTDTILLRRWAYLPAANAVNKTGDTMTGKLSGTVVSMANFLDKTVVNTAATGTVTLDLSAADVFDLTLSGATTVALSNVPALSSETLGFVVRVSQGATAYGLSWFSGITWQTTGGTAPNAPAASKSIEYIFTTRNGTTFIGRKGAST